MADVFSKAVRSRVMSRIRGRDTGPELVLRRAMYAAGLRGWRCHRETLPGCPDVAFGETRVAVFVDGGFWHGHPSRFTPGKSGPYWDEKIRRNRERDRAADRALRVLGWRVVRIWDFDLLRDPEKAAARVRRSVESRSLG